MKLLLYNDYGFLKPMYDEDLDNKNKLKLGKSYWATIKLARNIDFHRKYFKLISVAWELLGEKTHKFFKTKDSFRKTVEVTAGWSEPVYSISRNEWVEVPKSIAFDKMSQDEFEELYERVKDVIWELLDERNLITIDNFNNILKDF